MPRLGRNPRWTPEKEAELVYEDKLQAYRFAFKKGFSQGVIDIIKKAIPANERDTSGPPKWEWFFSERWYELVKLALEGAGFKITIITKEEIDELRRKQAEAQQHAWKPAVLSLDTELEKFRKLLFDANIIHNNGRDSSEIVRQWSLEEAKQAYKKATRYYHPDLHPERAESMSVLNSTWMVLSDKEKGYYK